MPAVVGACLSVTLASPLASDETARGAVFKVFDSALIWDTIKPSSLAANTPGYQSHSTSSGIPSTIVVGDRTKISHKFEVSFGKLFQRKPYPDWKPMICDSGEGSPADKSDDPLGRMGREYLDGMGVIGDLDRAIAQVLNPRAFCEDLYEDSGGAELQVCVVVTDESGAIIPQNTNRSSGFWTWYGGQFCRSDYITEPHEPTERVYSADFTLEAIQPTDGTVDIGVRVVVFGQSGALLTNELTTVVGRSETFHTEIIADAGARWAGEWRINCPDCSPATLVLTLRETDVVGRMIYTMVQGDYEFPPRTAWTSADGQGLEAPYIRYDGATGVIYLTLVGPDAVSGEWRSGDFSGPLSGERQPNRRD